MRVYLVILSEVAMHLLIGSYSKKFIIDEDYAKANQSRNVVYEV